MPLGNIDLVGNWQGVYAVAKRSHTVTFHIYRHATLQPDQWSDMATRTMP